MTRHEAISHALLKLRPGASWVLRGESYSDLEWSDVTQTIPSENELAATADTIQNAPDVPQSISDRQFFQQLAIDGIISEDEALASNAAVIPAPLLAIINKMPSEQQFAAKMLVSGATVYERNHPMTLAIGAAYGWTEPQIDAFFTAAAAL